MISRRINPPIVRHSHNWLAALTAIIISLYTLFFKVSLVKVKAFNGFFFFYFFSLPLYIMSFFFFFFLLITMVHATIKRLQIFRVSSLGFLLPPRRVIFVSSPACTQAHTQAFSFVLSFLSLPFIANFSSLVQSSHALSRTHFFVSRKLIARRPLYTASHCSLCLSSVSISPRSVLFFSLYISLFSLSLPSFLFRFLTPRRYAIVRQLYWREM